MNDLGLLYSKLKFYCPACELELTGNSVGDTHVSPEAAWGRHECEYTVHCDRPPVTSLDRLEESLKRKQSQLEELPKEIEQLKVLRVGLIEQQKKQ